MFIHANGVDPGLVHTGVVSMSVNDVAREIHISYQIVMGPNVDAVRDFLSKQAVGPTYIEGYRTRGQFNTNDRMIRAVADMKAGLPHSKILANTGIKKVVKPELLRVLQLEKFPVSNHQDLESAARIMVLGMLKDVTQNQVLATRVTDHMNGVGWTITGN